MPYPKHLTACGAVFRNSTGTCEQVNGIIKTSRDAYWHLIPRRNGGQGSLIGNYFEDRRCLSQNPVRRSPYTAFPLQFGLIELTVGGDLTLFFVRHLTSRSRVCFRLSAKAH